MKRLKRQMKMTAAVTALMVSLSLASCDQDTTWTYRTEDWAYEVTSGMYVGMSISAYNSGYSQTDVDTSQPLYDQQIGSVDALTWVQQEVDNLAKKYLAVETKFEEYGLSFTEEEQSYIDSYIEYYWNYLGSSYEDEGCGQESYTNLMTNSFKESQLFYHIYGEGGEKEIAADEVKDTMYKNFIIADMLQASFSGLEDDEITETKEQFDKYAEELKAGTKTFEEVYNDYNDIDEEEDTDTSSGSSSSSSSTESSSTESSSSDATSSEDTSSDSEEEEELEPLDSYASILGAEDTVYESEHFDTVNKMATNEIQIIELDDDAGIILVVKKDIKADPYYLENLDSTTRHLIADEEFESDIEKYAGELELTVNDYAVNQFKVKKIKEPTAS